MESSGRRAARFDAARSRLFEEERQLVLAVRLFRPSGFTGQTSMGAKSLERGDAATYRDKDRCCDRSTDLVVQEYIRFVVDCVYTRRLISLIVVDSGVHLARLRLVPSGPPSFRARLPFAENRLFLPLPYLTFPSLPFPSLPCPSRRTVAPLATSTE